MTSKTDSIKVDDVIERLAEDRSSEENWSSLYKLLWPFVIGSVFRMLGGDRNLAEDVSQEVFLRLVRFCDFSAFPNGKAFLGYLHTICHNAARDAWRKHLTVNKSDQLSLLPSPDSGHEEVETHLLLAKVFSELRNDDLALAEYLLKGYTLKEISSAMNQSYGSLAVRFHRLRDKLQRIGRK